MYTDYAALFGQRNLGDCDGRDVWVRWGKQKRHMQFWWRIHLDATSYKTEKEMEGNIKMDCGKTGFKKKEVDGMEGGPHPKVSFEFCNQ
jgi:hypothetical protein